MERKAIQKARKKRIPEHKRVVGIEVKDHGSISVENDGVEEPEKGRKKGLSTWYATAICGNDITSSCLYVAAISTKFAGRLAPICLLGVAGLLYLFRKIYGEVVGALPLNGGAYNALLNSTTKFKASMAACMTILSYMATAVISAKTAVAYAASISSIPIIPVTIGVLAGFMILTIMGISESARAALFIFIIHIGSLTVLVVIGGIYAFIHPEIFTANWSTPLPMGQGVALSLFLGFSSGLLGISGFESSANFVEEQQPGVFPKTLRNMWIAVTVFNPLIALLALGILPLAEITSEANQDFLLASMGQAASGGWLHTLIAVDAALVLCGAVLTSFVGVGGLVRRMTLDRCLPQYLLKKNKRGSYHRISILFFMLCTSIVLITNGDLLALAGVYTISFLLVMSLFVIGNILLKIRRSRLRRPEQAGWFTVIFALGAVIAGLVGNVLIDTRNLVFFLTYFLPTMAVVGIMFLRIHLLKMALAMIRGLATKVQGLSENLGGLVLKKMDEINSQGIIFFSGGDSLATLNNAMLYVRQNELSKWVRVIHLYKNRDKVPQRLEQDLKFLDEVYPEIKIDLLLIQGEFNPDTVDKLSKKYSVPKNYMFIGAPGDRFPHDLADLGGVRLIV